MSQFIEQAPLESELPQAGSVIKWIPALRSCRREPESSNLNPPFPPSGNDNKHAPIVRPPVGENAELPAIPAPPLPDSSFRLPAAGGRAAPGLLDRLFPTRSTTYIPVGVPSRRIPDFLSIAATGLLDRSFPTRSTTCIPVGVPSRRLPDILSIAAAGLLDRSFPTRSTTYIPAGVPSRRLPDILSIAAAGLLPSRRLPDILSINHEVNGFRPLPG